MVLADVFLTACEQGVLCSRSHGEFDRIEEKLSGPALGGGSGNMDGGTSYLRQFHEALWGLECGPRLGLNKN
jgi:hypothetical protein